MESILTSIKLLLGVPEELEHFDTQIIMHINTVLMTLNQIGVGVKGFRIEDDTSVWNDFIPDSTDFEAVKTYVYMQVKLVFDTPTGSSTVEAYNRKSSELQWRLNIAAESNT